MERTGASFLFNLDVTIQVSLIRIRTVRIEFEAVRWSIV